MSGQTNNYIRSAPNSKPAAWRKSLRGLTSLVMLWLLLLPAAIPAAAQTEGTDYLAQQQLEEILVGGIFDTSGPTSVVGRHYARGAADAVKYINSQGGINGTPLRLLANDYGSRPRRAGEVYKALQENQPVFAVLGWGAADTKALESLANADEVVFMAAAFDPELSNPQKTPYYFSIGATYADQARLAMQWAKNNGAERVCFIYPDTPFGKLPLVAGKTYAEKIGLKIGPDVQVDLRATDATLQLQKIKEYDPEFAWLGGVSPSTEVILRDAAKLELKTKFIINNWGLDERLPALVGSPAEGRLFGFSVVRPFGENVAAAAQIKNYTRNDVFTLHYNVAWASMIVLWQGLKKAAQDGRLNGPGLKNALETLKDIQTGGLTPPLNYTPKDHRGTTACGLYTIKGGRLTLVADLSVDRSEEDFAQ